MSDSVDFLIQYLQEGICACSPCTRRAVSWLGDRLQALAIPPEQWKGDFAPVRVPLPELLDLLDAGFDDGLVFVVVPRPTH